MSAEATSAASGEAITLAFAGDCFPARPLGAQDEAAYADLKEVLRSADVAMTNAETLFHEFEAAPVPDSGPYGTYAACPPEVIEDLHHLGFGVVATANNHGADYGEQGVLVNAENLRRHRMPFAGSGRTLAEATAATYLGVQQGTVALVSVTLTPPAGDHRAGDPTGVVRGRPGVNLLRSDSTHEVPQHAFDDLAALGDRLRLGRFHRRSDDVVRVGGLTFARGTDYRTTERLHEGDLARNVHAIQDARRFADWVVVSLHNHERGQTKDEPAEAAVRFAHAAVDAGADVVFGHGPHIDRGIEIYRDRPILFSLGNFVLHNELIPHQPADFAARFSMDPASATSALYDARIQQHGVGRRPDPLEYRSAIATVTLSRDGIDRIELHPVDLGADRLPSRRGTPSRASDRVAEQILDRFQRLSAPFGTKVDIRTDAAGRPVGVITP